MEWLKFIQPAFLASLFIVLPIYLIVSVIGKYMAKGKSVAFPIVVSVAMAIMAVCIVLPNFLKFTVKARTSEAKVNLSSIAVATFVYSQEYKKMPAPKDGENFFDLVGWKPEYSTRYAYYCGKDVVMPVNGNADLPDPNKNWPLPIKPILSETELLCFAIGNVDSDPFLDVWTIDMKKNLVHQLDDIDDLVRYGKTPDQIWFAKNGYLVTTVAISCVLLAILLTIDSLIRRKKEASHGNA